MMTEQEDKDKEKEQYLELPGEKPIKLDLHVADGYFPMDDYAANNYEPTHGRGNHFCRACINYYKKLYKSGVTRFEFMPKCVGDISATSDHVTKEDFGEDYDYFKIVQNPVSFAKFEFNWTARWYQEEMLNCSAQFKCMRAGRRIGKCLTENSRILLRSGKYVSIKDLVEEESFTGLGVNPKKRQTIKRQKMRVTQNIVQPVFKVTTKTGRIIEASAEHPFLTWDGWTELQHMSKGCDIAVPGVLRTETTVRPDSPNRISDSQIKLMAYIIGDGGVTGLSAKFTNISPDIHEEIYTIAQDFGVDWRWEKGFEKTQGWFAKKKNTGKLNPVISFLKKHKIFGKNAFNKCVPDCVFSMSRAQQALFLSRIYACDGWASTSNSNTEIGYCSVNEQLVRDIQHLLLRFGIISTVRHRKTSKDHGAWTVDIHQSASIKIFIDEIGIYSKKEATDKILADISNKVQSVKPSDIYWDEVINIEPLGDQMTYSVEVLDEYDWDLKSFCANDIWSHNTESMAINALWHLYTNGGLVDNIFQILVIAPYQSQVELIFNLMRNFIKKSDSMSVPGLIKRDVRNPQLIELSNGATIRGFSSGSHSGAKSDKIRGQDANLIIIDEVDYVNDADIEVIMAILASDADCKLIVASTPKGVRQKLHQWSTDKNQKFKEFWYPSSESPSWTQTAENMFKTQYSKAGYAREFLAEFGDEVEGVFRSADISAALLDYDLKDCKYHGESKYVIGVDWNKTTGTHITIVEALRFENAGFKYRLVDLHVIRKSEFQQIAAIEKIMELDKKWGAKTSYIYVDAGYGHVQVEMMWKYDIDHPSENTNYRQRVKPITMNKAMEIRDPVTGEIRKKQTKQFMVDTSARALEQKQIILPKSEDTVTRIIPEEIMHAQIGLVQQMRNFTILKYSPTGVPTYSQDYEHTLTAWMLSIMGHFMEFSDIAKLNLNNDIAYSEGIGSKYGQSGNPIPGFQFQPDKTLTEAVEENKDLAKELRPGSRGIEDDGQPLSGDRDAGLLVSGLQSGQRAARPRRNRESDEKKSRFGRKMSQRRSRTDF